MDVKRRLPIEWQDLFRHLQHSVNRAVTWYENEHGSCYGRALVWFQLLQALSRLDPCIQNRQLAFKPRFFHFEEKIQINFLTFLEDIGAAIPQIYLSDFLRNIKKSSDQIVWLDSGLEKLKTAFNLQCDSEPEAVRQEKERCTEDEQTFEHFPRYPSVGEVEGGQDSEGEEDVIILDEEPPAKRARIDRDGTTLDTTDQLETTNGTGMGKDLDSDNECVKRLSISNSFVNEEDIAAETVREEFEQFNKDDIVRTIKESWQAGSSDVLSDKQRDKILSFSQKEMELFCSYIELEVMSDESVDAACRCVCQMSETLSYGSVVCILNAAMLGKLKGLSQNASRKFSGTVTLVTETFPKQVIDAVIVPVLTEVNITAVQVDLVGRLVKGSLSSAGKLYLLQRLIADNFSLIESKIPIIQVLCENTCALDVQTFGKILTMLDVASESLSKNLKFGKLLLALVNKHKSMINKESHRTLCLIVDKHNTFLKKSIHAALSKVKI